MLALVLLSSALALPPIEETLEKLHADPHGFAEALPERTLSSQLRLPIYPEAKQGCRRGVVGQKEAPGSNDRVEDLIDNPQRMLRTLESMEAQNLKSSKLKRAPWSDTYWPYALGSLGQRYQEDYFAYNYDWLEFKQFIDSHPASDLIAEGEVNKLSPSEKYDYLLGDEQWTFTKAQWQEGQRFYDSRGTVEGWMGHCHGWSAASFLLPTPKHSLKIISANKENEVELYVSDIKGLATLLYANGNVPSKFIGGRCNDKQPEEQDSRPVNSVCRDTNAGTWHLAVVNQIGLNQRSFVIDATYDYEVWNQPVFGYKYSYFEPQTKKLAHSIEEGRIEVKNFHADKRRRYRSPKAKWIIGVVMDLTYIAENAPSVSTDLEPNTRTLRYTYDLELDQNGNIIGGEWYNNIHPDFMWLPYEGTLPGANQLSNWQPGQPLSTGDLKTLRQNSLRSLPAGGIVKKLFDMAQ